MKMQLTPPELRNVIEVSKDQLAKTETMEFRPIELELGLVDPEELEQAVRAAKTRIKKHIQVLEEILAADEAANWWKGNNRIVEVLL